MLNFFGTVTRGMAAVFIGDTMRRRGYYRMLLKPLEQVVPLTPGCYHSTGNDPQFSLEPSRGRLPHGQVSVSFRYLAEHPCRPVLYADLGDGFTEASSWRLTSVESGMSVTLIDDLPRHTVALRLDPLDAAGEFRLEDVAIQELRFMPIEEIERMCAALPASMQTEVACDRLHGASYNEWLRRYDYVTDVERQEIECRLQIWHHRPRFRILLLPAEVPLVLLRAAVASLQRQVFTEWDLHVAGAVPDAWKPVLFEVSQQDARIHMHLPPSNGPDYAGFLEPDAELHPLALLCVALAIRGRRRPALVYTDEDRLTAAAAPHSRHRCEPYFKPDWNPDLLLAQDYVGGFAALCMDRVRAAGGFPEDLDRRAIRRLILRLADGIQTCDVVHIPKVLYHRRSPRAFSVSDATLVRETLHRRGIDAVVELNAERDGLRIRYPIRQHPLVTILMSTRDRVDLLRRAVDSVLEKTRYDRFEVCVIDNDSTDPATLAYLEATARRARVRVISVPGAFNYSEIQNRAARVTSADILVFLNNDTEVLSGDWLQELVSYAIRPTVGAVGALLLFPNGTLQHAGVVLGSGGIANHVGLGLPADTCAARDRAHAVQEYSAVTAACMAMRRSVFAQMVGFDAENLPVRFNDVDLCLRLREAGYRIVWTPHAVLRHYHSASIRGLDDTAEGSARFSREVAYMSRRWRDQLLRDPFYNANLDTTALDFSLACPPRVPRFELP